MNTDYPLRFINSAIDEFQNSKDHGTESFIISSNLFGITKPFISTETSYFELRKFRQKHFLKIFLKFSNNDLRVAITWKTRNIRSLFLLKDKNHYKSCVIYQEDTQLLHSHLGGWSRVHQVQNVCEQGEGVSHQWDRLYINFLPDILLLLSK